MKKIYLFIFLYTSLPSLAAEKRLRIQEKKDEIEQLKKQHAREIYLLKKQNAEQMNLCQLQIAALLDALEQTRARDREEFEQKRMNHNSDPHPLATMHGYR